MIFNRGKYQGYRVSDVPTEYLGFVLGHPEASSQLKKACAEEIAKRFGVEGPTRTVYKTSPGGSLSSDKFKKWYRRAALAAHPDRGGSVALMKLINELNDLVG